MAISKNPATRAVPTITIATIKQSSTGRMQVFTWPSLDGQAEKLRFFPDSFA